MDAQRGISRRMVIGLPAEGLSASWERDFAAYPPAGVIIFRRNFQDLEDLRGLTVRLRDLARPRRLFLAMDEEGGHVSQLAPDLVVPPNALLLARGAEGDDLEWAARVTGARLRALGIDWVFAPVADIHSEPRNPVIGPRAYGTDPDAVARALGGVLGGFRAAGIAACLKHFPGHGDTVVDSHLALPVQPLDRAALGQRELFPFRAHRDADAVMTAHVVYPALDAERPASRSAAITHDLLRTELGFAGVCITDALEMKGATGDGGLSGAARGALEAGADLLLFAFHDETLRRVRLELAHALEDGAIARTYYDAARPRLEAFAAAHPEPRPDELATPLEALTPPDWTARLERIVERGVEERGGANGPPPGGPWRIEVFGPTGLSPLAAELEARGIRTARGSGTPWLTDELRGLGVALAEGDAPVTVAVVASRTPLGPAELERLRAACRARPTIAVALQNDAFLDDVPEAALRISALDATPLTRRVVARRLAKLAARATA